MTMRFALFFLSLVAVVAAGCSSPCSSRCAEQNRCAGAFPEDCRAVCGQQQDTAALSGCASQYSAYATCAGATTNVCTDVPQTRCAHEAAAYQTCVAGYCATHATDSLCRTPVP